MVFIKCLLLIGARSVILWLVRPVSLSDSALFSVSGVRLHHDLLHNPAADGRTFGRSRLCRDRHRVDDVCSEEAARRNISVLQFYSYRGRAPKEGAKLVSNNT